MRGNPVGKGGAIVPIPFLYNLLSHYLWYLGALGKKIPTQGMIPRVGGEKITICLSYFYNSVYKKLSKYLRPLFVSLFSSAPFSISSSFIAYAFLYAATCKGVQPLLSA